MWQLRGPMLDMIFTVGQMHLNKNCLRIFFFLLKYDFSNNILEIRNTEMYLQFKNFCFLKKMENSTSYGYEC